MIKKRSILFLLCTAVFLTSCASNNTSSSSVSSDYYDESMGTAFATETGIYHANSSNFLYFYDYESKKDVLVCSKQNCTHEAWDENTPDEQKCNGYLGNGLCAGFVANNTLYILSVDPSEAESRLYSSQLDRSQQKLLCKVPSGTTVPSFVVQDNILYLGISQAQMNDSNSPNAGTNSAKTDTWFTSINLNTGKCENLTESETAYNADLHVIGSGEHTIYLERTYFEKEFTGTNYADAKIHTQFFSYDTQAASYQEIIHLPEGVSSAYAFEDQLLYAKNDPQRSQSYTMYQISGKNASETQIGTSSTPPASIGQNIILNTEKGYVRYDINSQHTQPITGTILNNFRCFQEFGSYYYGVPLSDNAAPCLISKEDLYNGREQFVKLIW